ncbi:hypothetical protein [Desertibacillus haloalkaliphilus]|uniref:hypothetical protein n=1 Tax=Desertibacillus haloalkaliphilus TaxID=1328930 RepID=UPI001C25C37E|nr:hypothetical protein [Desertibacillus haloalkaliphilus]MBU8905681.1 hypothetical protein [Desertibacillus haloalkaliphilus]
MDPRRKETIIKEIKYWKQNSLLPEHYCDFLLTLYTEGTEETDSKKHSFFSLEAFKASVSISFVIVLLLITIVVIYFTDFSFVLQMTVLATIMAVLFLIAWYISKSSQLLSHLYILFAALLSFLMLVHVTSEFFPENRLAMGIAVFITCVLWMLSGIWWKVRFLMIAGIVGLSLLGIFVILEV